MASESSSGNSRPSLRRPTTSTVWPIRRAAAMPPSATRLMPASCIGRKRSGIRIDSALPTTSSSVWPNISSAPRFQEMMSPFWSAAMIASVADSATERKRFSDSRRASPSCWPAIWRPSWRPMCAVTSSRRSSGVTACSEKHSMTAKVLSPIGIGKENAPRRPTSAPASARGKLASQVTSTIQAGRPVAATRPGRPMPGASGVPERRGAERLELGRVPEVPDVRRLQRVVIALAGRVGVADGPAGPAADVLDAGLDRVFDGLGLGGGGGDGLDQADEGRVGRERHPAARLRRGRRRSR